MSFEEARVLHGGNDRGKSWTLQVHRLPVGLDSEPLLVFGLHIPICRGNAVYAVRSQRKCLCVFFPELPPTEPTKSENK